MGALHWLEGVKHLYDGPFSPNNWPRWTRTHSPGFLPYFLAVFRGTFEIRAHAMHTTVQ